MKVNPKLLAAVSSYGRSFLAAALAVWSTGNHDVKGLAAAGAAAVLPVILRALNPKDPAFGLVKLALPEVEKQLASILADSNNKAAAKKATTKKLK